MLDTVESDSGISKYTFITLLNLKRSDKIFKCSSIFLVWNQVKAAVEKSNAKIRDFFKDKLDALKPKIMEALEKSKDKFNKFKEIVVDGSQKIWVRMEEAGVKIVADLKGGKWGKKGFWTKYNNFYLDRSCFPNIPDTSKI